MVEQLLEQRYEILQVLQSGPLVQQFLGCDRAVPEQPKCWITEFAVQDPRPDVLAYARQLFEYEAKRFAQLSQHPTLPDSWDAFELDHKFYLVQQWLPGQTLAELLPIQHQAPEPLVFDLVRSVAESLAFVHGHNTLHCNLSPQNLLWHEQRQTWCLLNFGAFYQVGLLGLDPEGDVQLLGRLGVPGYIPPNEQAPVDPQYDFYSLAIIAIEALLGQHPGTPAAWREHLNFPITVNLSTCLDRLLAGEYETANAIVEDLQTTDLVSRVTRYHSQADSSQASTPTFSDSVSFSDLLADELPPDTLLAGRYRLVRPLSHGGFGQTYLAIDEQFPGQPHCVVKKLKPQHDSPKVLKIAAQMFQREAEVLSQLGQHDQIPQLMAHFEEEDEFYLVEEFVDGHDLESELPLKIKLPEARVVRLLTDILEVLSFVHAQKVIHRDLKPANIRRRKEDKKLVLIDFGAVKQLGDVTPEPGQTKLTVSIGTAGFAPSEQTQGRPRLSSDVYAVGMIGIQALTGVDPETLPQDPKTGEIVWRPLAKVSPELEKVISQMVRYDFRQRYPAARQALQALQQLYAPQRSPEFFTTETPNPVVAKRTPMLIRRYRWPLGVATGLVMLGGLGLLGYRLGWFNPSARQLRDRIAASTVQVKHADGDGFSTGVLIPGNSYECKVLTSSAAIAAGREVTVAIDGAAKAIEASRTFEGLEVVELTIASETTQCPYAVLPLGDSSQVEQGDAVYLGGFVQPPGTDVTEQDLLATTVEQVLTIPITGGYRLGYTTDAQPSLPGNIMLNLQGQVVGIHGPVAEDSLNARSQGLGWAIPLRSYLIAVEGGGDAVDQAQQVQDQADQLFSAQRYEEALVAYEQLARLRPERPEPWYGQGSSLYNLNRYEDAIAAYDKALEIRPENALIWYSRGNAYFLIQDYEAAQESYENAVRYEADYFTAMNNLGLTFQALEQYDTALELYEAVIELRPEYPSAWNNKGTILSLRRDWPGALAAYDQAIALRPTFSNAWYNRAIVYSQQNDIPRALENLKEAIALRKVWAEEAQADINFQKLKDNPEFQALVN